MADPELDRGAGASSLGRVGAQIDGAPGPWMIALGLLVFGGAAVASMIRGMPDPTVHDEFAYVLQGQTFAQGRITNPTHPLWQHFETFHVIHEPTYTAKYPPAQGVALGAGILMGHPLVGVWLSVAMMSVALSWMLMQWFNASWALLGSLLISAHLGVASYWGHSYWGGALAAVGGALVLGGLRGSLKCPQRSHGVFGGIGLLVLANTRPWEGLLLAALSCVLFLVVVGKRRRLPHMFLRRSLPPLLLVSAAGAGLMGYYNWRVTGDVTLLPYAHYQDAYGMAPTFFWGEPRVRPMYRHEVMERYQTEYTLPRYYAMQNPSAFASRSARKIIVLMLGFCGPSILLLALFPRAVRDPWVATAALMLVVLAFLALFTVGHRHYLAPVTGLVALVVVGCITAGWKAGGRARQLTQGMIVFSLAYTIAVALSSPVVETSEFTATRRTIVRTLNELPQRDLVFVRYGRDHSVFEEWVYNGPHIDDQPIVWARDRGPILNQTVVRYFDDRRAWLLEANGEIQLRTYERAGMP